MTGDELPHVNVGCVFLQPFAKMGRRKCVGVIVSVTNVSLRHLVTQRQSK